MNRTQTKQIHVGPVAIGGGAPVAVQSMCNTHTSDARATIEQIARLHDAGCEIIRLAVPDQAAADALPEIVHASPMPVVADIHFDYRLALAAAKAGVHKIRINPGNIGEPDNVRKVAEACRELRGMIERGEENRTHMLFPPKLIIRDTTLPLPDSCKQQID